LTPDHLEVRLTVSIIIADDHGLLRAGLASLLNSEPDLQVIAEAADGDTALDLAKELRPDVLLADISMPGASGIEIARALRTAAPGTRVLIVTMHEDLGLVREAISEGAAGYLIKRAAQEELLTAVRTVAKGDTYLPPALADRLRGTAHQPRETRAAPDLAPAELEMLRLIAHGHTNAQIAVTLGISAEAAACVRAELSRQLGIHSRTSLVAYAYEHGLL
jgi:two-component system, NarL family, response regulator NreC